MRDDDRTDEEEREFQEIMRAACKPSPATLKKRREQFVKVPLWWAQQAAHATRTQQAYVWIWLLRLSWEHKSATFPLPNGRLERAGIDRRTKRRALARLKAAGLIQTECRRGKSPLVTVCSLRKPDNAE
jgi:hypothetical protein